MRRHHPLAAEHPAFDPSAVGAEGRPFCRRCLRELAADAREFCSPACRHDFLMCASATYAREAVFARDQGVCTHCGLDCGRLDRIIAAMRAQGAAAAADLAAAGGEAHAEAAPSADELALWTLAQLGLGRRKRIVSSWQADHRLAVAEGGGRCGLGNLRTLCLACHRRQTRDLHRRLAARSSPWSG